MGAATITAARVNDLKLDAKILREQNPRLKHSAALEQIAHAEGFSNWAELVVAAGGNEAVDAARMEKPATERQLRQLQRREHYRRRAQEDSEGGPA